MNTFSMIKIYFLAFVPVKGSLYPDIERGSWSNALVSKLAYVTGVAKSGNDVRPEEEDDKDELVEAAEEEEVIWVHFPRVFHTLLLHDVH